MDVHFALSRKIFPKSSLQIDVVHELKWTNICHWFVSFFTTWVIGGLVNNGAQIKTNNFCALDGVGDSVSRPFMPKFVPIIAPKMSKNAAKQKNLLFMSHQFVLYCSAYVLSIINKIHNWEFCSCRNVYQGVQVAPQPKKSQNGSQNVKNIKNE